MDNFNLTAYLANNILLKESEEEKIVDQLKSSMDQILNSLEDKLEDESSKVNEGLLTTASIAIALPAIMGLISKFGLKANQIIQKMLGKKPNDNNAYNQWMSKLGHIADELHHLYMTPIKGLVSKFVKDKNKANKIADIVFHLIVASFLVASGVTAVKALAAKNVQLTLLESALTAIKSGEIKNFILKSVGV
jgi:hypothetical protein